MESFLATLIKFKSPISATIGAGLGILAVALQVERLSANATALTLFAVAAAVLGAGFGAAISAVLEQIWKWGRPLRSMLSEAIKRRALHRQLKGLSLEERDFLAEKLSTQTRAYPAIEFEWHEAHFVQSLLDKDLVNLLPNPTMVKIVPRVWSWVCQRPDILGLKLETVRRRSYGKPDAVFMRDQNSRPGE